MQTNILSEQDSDQRRSQRSNSHLGNLFTGLLVGLCLVFLERRNQQLATTLPNRPRSWRHTLLTCFWIALALFVLVNLLMGP